MRYLISILEAYASHRYDGEDVTQLQHALQCAEWAIRDHASPSTVAAALFHDIGHLDDVANGHGRQDRIDDQHEHRAVGLLRPFFNEQVFCPVRLHVIAKRYLCTIDPGYLEGLSVVSQTTFVLQGGLLTERECQEFERDSYHQNAIRLRKCDDMAKDPTAQTRSIGEIVSYIENHI